MPSVCESHGKKRQSVLTTHTMTTELLNQFTRADRVIGFPKSDRSTWAPSSIYRMLPTWPGTGNEVSNVRTLTHTTYTNERKASENGNCMWLLVCRTSHQLYGAIHSRPFNFSRIPLCRLRQSRRHVSLLLARKNGEK